MFFLGEFNFLYSLEIMLEVILGELSGVVWGVSEGRMYFRVRLGALGRSRDVFFRFFFRGRFRFFG